MLIVFWLRCYAVRTKDRLAEARVKAAKDYFKKLLEVKLALSKETLMDEIAKKYDAQYNLFVKLVFF